jgi:hypothetical protein
MKGSTKLGNGVRAVGPSQRAASRSVAPVRQANAFDRYGIPRCRITPPVDEPWQIVSARRLSPLGHPARAARLASGENSVCLGRSWIGLGSVQFALTR